MTKEGLRSAALACLLLLCTLGPAASPASSDKPGAPLPVAPPDQPGSSSVPAARATSVESWLQTTYDDFGRGTLAGAASVNRSGGELTLRSIDIRTSPFANEGITAASDGPQGTVVLGTSKGTLIRINSSTGEILHCGPAVAGEQRVTALACGHDGAVWGGTSPSGKLFRMDPFSFAIISLGVGVAGESSITTMTTAPDGSIWGGTSPGGRVFKISPGTATVTPFGQAVGGETAVTALAFVSASKLWGGTFPTGELFQMDTDTGGYALKGKSVADATIVTAMVFTQASELWAACDGATTGKLLLLDTTGGSPVLWSSAPVACETVVNCLAADADGTLWGGTGRASKLFCFDPLSKSVLKVWSILASEYNITALARAADGSLWGGTDRTPKLLSISSTRTPGMQAATLGRSRSGRYFFDDFSVLRNNKPGDWTEQNTFGGSWSVATEPDRGNVYSQDDTSALSTVSLAGDPNWTDLYFETLVKITGNSGVDPGGNGARAGFRSNLTGDRYVVDAFEPQNVVNFRKVGSSTALVASYITPVLSNKWASLRINIQGQTVHIWYNGTEVTPGAGLPTTGTYTKGLLGLGARLASARFDDVSAFRDTSMQVVNLHYGQIVTLCNESGGPLVTAVALGNTLTFDLSSFCFPLKGYFNITDPDGSPMLYTSPLIPDIWGGDVYSLNLTSPTRYYLPDGEYISPAYDAQYAAPWREVYWGVQQPSGTNVSVTFRGADNASALPAAAWSAPVNNSGSAIPLAASRWLQYRARLKTIYEQSAPVVDHFNITYDVLTPDIVITKTASKPACFPGDTLNFTIGLENRGAGVAPEARVNDTLPKGLEFLGSSAEAQRSGPFWTLTNISPGEKRSFNITARLNGTLGNGAVMENRAQVIATDKGGGTQEPSLANATVTAITPVLELDLSSPNTTVRPGEVLVLNASILNSGSAPARNLNLTLAPPFSGSLLSWEGGPGLLKVGELTWSLASLDPKAYANLTLTFRIADLPLGVVLEPGLSAICSDDIGRMYGPLTTSCTIPVRVFLPDYPVLNMTGKATPEKVAPGSNVTLDLRFENNGGNTSRRIEALVELSPEFILPSRVSTVRHNITNLTSLASNTLSIAATVNSSVLDGDVLWANVTASYTNETGAPLGQATLRLLINVTAPRISVLKVALAASAAPGQNVTFAVLFNNTGSAAEPELVIRELPPPGLTYLCATMAPDSNMAWRFRNVQPGGNSFFITFRVNSTAVIGGMTVNRIQFNGTRIRGNTSEASLLIALPPQTDFVAPAVLLTTPRNGERDVATGTNIEILFSEPMNQTATEAAFSMNPRPGGRLLWDGNKLVFKPARPLSENTQYDIKLKVGARDLAGNQLSNNFTLSFHTRGISADFTNIAFGLAALMLVIVVVETIYLLAMRRKWMGEKPEPEPEEEESNKEPAHEPPPPPPLPEILSAARGETAKLPVEDAKDAKAGPPQKDSRKDAGPAPERKRSVLPTKKSSAEPMEMPVSEPVDENEDEPELPTTYAARRKDRKAIPSGDVEKQPAKVEQPPEEDIDEDADPLGAMLQKGVNK